MKVCPYISYSFRANKNRSLKISKIILKKLSLYQWFNDILARKLSQKDSSTKKSFKKTASYARIPRSTHHIHVRAQCDLRYLLFCIGATDCVGGGRSRLAGWPQPRKMGEENSSESIMRGQIVIVPISLFFSCQLELLYLRTDIWTLNSPPFSFSSHR